MLLSEFALTLRRRWKMLCCGLCLALAFGVMAGVTVKPSYSATAEVLLLPPASAVPAGSNPYLELGRLPAAAAILAKDVGSQSSVETLSKSGLVGTLQSEVDTNTPAPLVMVTVSAASSDVAKLDLDLVLAFVPKALEQLQRSEGVSSQALITSSVISRQLQPEVSRKTQIRSVLAVTLLFAILTVLAIGALDAALEHRRTRSATRKNHYRSRDSRRRISQTGKPATPASSKETTAPSSPNEPSARHSTPTPRRP